ncbi:branched-chain amino acid ABC transporter permease [Noviherbaspirillum sp. Root189]|uniref:branched-chain amino acid ABC transporter permease n=1 Tax=Noviherbaspirillum sp. Root189 TaxID=1736487 RepID=UPI0009E76745|nr:branched-chain amino acid ABC transporter permease [Noviherbaspirillum sp. Root189]
MSANKWRHATSTVPAPRHDRAAASAAAKGKIRPHLKLATTPASVKTPSATSLRRMQALRYAVVLVALVVYPWVASSFFTFQVAGQALVLGIIGLSLAFLAGYGGMVSLSQMTVAGIAGYAVAIFGQSAVSNISLGWPWWLGALTGVVLAVVVATLIGLISVRTDGIYTIMITLAIGVAMFYLAQQNHTVFNGFQGFSRVTAPVIGGISLRDPVPFFYVALALGLSAYAAVKYLVRAPFGMALQGVRDNARRMRALGFDVTAHRVAAHAFSGLIAGIGGVLLVWYNAGISPGTIGADALINILVVAVLGGMRHPIGPFIGALVFVLLQNFAIDLIDRERFNLVIGGAFLLIVLFSPDGLLGLWHRARGYLHPATKR